MNNGIKNYRLTTYLDLIIDSGFSYNPPSLNPVSMTWITDDKKWLNERSEKYDSDLRRKFPECGCRLSELLREGGAMSGSIEALVLGFYEFRLRNIFGSRISSEMFQAIAHDLAFVYYSCISSGRYADQLAVTIVGVYAQGGAPCSIGENGKATGIKLPPCKSSTIFERWADK